MQISLHTRERKFSSSAMKHADGSVSVVLVCSAGQSSDDDTITIFPTRRSYSQQLVQVLREAADKMERLLGVEPPTMPTEPTITARCSRCGVRFEVTDGHMYCEECEAAVEDERAAADAAEGHPCHRDDQ